MNEQTRKSFFSSEDQRWATPPNLFNRFNEVFDFKLDPCAVKSTAKCDIFYTKEENGLVQSWSLVGNAFVNPPFSRELPKWIKKSYDESQKGIVVGMLIPARPDTIAWHNYCLQHAAILFIKGRITFLDQSDKPIKRLTPAFFPSALVVFGRLEEYDLQKLGDLGIWMKRNA